MIPTMELSNNFLNESISTILTKTNNEAIFRRIKHALSKTESRCLVLIISPLDGAILDKIASTISNDILIVSICFSSLHAQEYTLDKDSQLYKSNITLLYDTTMETHLSRLIEESHIKTCKLVYYSSEAYRYKLEAEALWHNCLLAIKQHWANHATTSYFGAKWLHNIWNNLSQSFAYGLPQVQNDLKKHSDFAIVIGAGPSLSTKVLEFVAKNRDKCTIFATDTALPTLQKYSIVPHYCVLLESQYYNMQDLLPMPHQDTIAIGDICCYPASLRMFSNTACISSQFAPIPFFATHGEKLPPLVPPLGSVGLLSLYLAIHFKASHIFMVGLDFSYYKGLSHSIHSATYSKWQNGHTRTMPWLYANAHFSNSALQYVQSLTDNSLASTLVNREIDFNSVSHRRVQDASLQSFRQKLEYALLPFAKNHNTVCMDLNSESIIKGVKKISLQSAQSLVDKTAKPPSIIWKSTLYLDNEDNAYNSIQRLQKATNMHATSILHYELKKSKHIQQRMKELMKEDSLPKDEDWKSGLDNYTFMLPEDPYTISRDLTLWKKNNIYSKIYVIAKRIEQDINLVFAGLK